MRPLRDRSSADHRAHACAARTGFDVLRRSTEWAAGDQANRIRMLHMLRFVLSLRVVMLIASLGSAVGAALMFWEGGVKLLAAIAAIFDTHDSKAVIAPVMGA